MIENEFTEWKKRNDSLIEEMELFEDNFRKSRNCDCEKVVFENGKAYCKHLIAARTKKFKTDIQSQIHFLI